MPLRRIALVLVAVMALPVCLASQTQPRKASMSERLSQSDCEGPKAVPRRHFGTDDVRPRYPYVHLQGKCPRQAMYTHNRLRPFARYPRCR